VQHGRRAIEGLQRFLLGGGFPSFALCLMLFYEVLLVALLLAPAGDAGLGAFAEDFRIWCYGYDPATGRMEWSYVMAMTVPPLMLAGVLVLLWWEPLAERLRRPRSLAPPAAAAALLVCGAAGLFAALGAGPARGELPFPAEELRTALRPPALSLVNQRGEPIELSALGGKVVMLTAVYASCPHTCPLILAQAKRAVDELGPAERADLRVVAVTLDPAQDSSAVLAQLAGNHGLEAPLFNLVTGEPDRVEATLDAMGVARRRDPETGVIDHANLFLLVDRGGKLAYRFSLGERQERWLASALKVLLREPPDAGVASDGGSDPHG